MNEKFDNMWYQFLAPLRPAVDPMLVMVQANSVDNSYLPYRYVKKYWAYGMDVTYRTWIAPNTDYKEIPIHVANGYIQGLVEQHCWYLCHIGWWQGSQSNNEAGQHRTEVLEISNMPPVPPL